MESRPCVRSSLTIHKNLFFSFTRVEIFLFLRVSKWDIPIKAFQACKDNHYEFYKTYDHENRLNSRIMIEIQIIPFLLEISF